MKRSAILRIIRPLVERVARGAAKKLMDPCVRYVWWHLAYQRWSEKGRDLAAEIAFWRLTALHKKCRRIAGGQCDSIQLMADAMELVYRQMPPPKRP